MTGIMVLGHGHFASGIASAAELILGKQPANKKSSLF